MQSYQLNFTRVAKSEVALLEKLYEEDKNRRFNHQSLM
jgi:hypothetical protein